MINEANYQDKQEEYFLQTQHEVAQFIDKKGVRILDIGCGGGQTGRWLKESGIAREVHGVELVSSAAEKAQQYLDSVLVADIQSFDFKGQYEQHSFDYIIATEVLEHLTFPKNILETLKYILKPGGKIIASVPNMQHLRVLWHLGVQGDWHYRQSGPFDYTHLRFFTRKSFRRLFESAGYDVVGTSPVLLEKAKLINKVTFGMLEPYMAFRYFCIATYHEKR